MDGESVCHVAGPEDKRIMSPYVAGSGNLPGGSWSDRAHLGTEQADYHNRFLAKESPLLIGGHCSAQGKETGLPVGREPR
jgi:hypothetical protein